MRIAANTPNGKSPVSRTTRRLSAAVLAVPLSLALALPLTTAPAAAQGPGSGTSYLEPDEVPERVPQATTEQDLPGLPDGVDVDRVEWIGDRWANVYINTPSMPEEPVLVQILLARDW